MIELFIDGSWSSNNPGLTGWAFVSSDGAVRRSGCLTGEITAMHQVGGELKACMEAIMYAYKEREDEVVIYHDYEGVASWALGYWKAKNPHTQAYVKFVQKARKNINIRFVKIPAGQNPADELARSQTGAQDRH